MHVIFHIIVRRLAPYYDGTNLVVKMLIACLISAGAAGWVEVNAEGWRNANLPIIVSGGGAVGLMASVGLLWNDLKKRRRIQAGLPRKPWAKRRVMKTLTFGWLIYTIPGIAGLVLWQAITGRY